MSVFKGLMLDDGDEVRIFVGSGLSLSSNLMSRKRVRCSSVYFVCVVLLPI